MGAAGEVIHFARALKEKDWHSLPLAGRVAVPASATQAEGRCR